MLDTPDIFNSMDRWWANCIRNRQVSESIRDLIRKVRKEGYIFRREEYLREVKMMGKHLQLSSHNPRHDPNCCSVQ
jgi:(p)ppGpp synthase/HD superfamily hydrolase